jgi:MFS family permease
MKLSTLMIVNAIIAAVFGLGFVFAPGHVTSLYGPEVGVTLRYVAQLFGAALLGFAVLTWVARNAPDSEARHAILLALFVGDGVGFILALIGQIGGVVNALGWSTVVIYLLLALGFGYFAFVAKPELPRT